MLVSVAYATSEQQLWLDVNVSEGSSVINAIHSSGILSLCPNIQLEKQKVGVFGKVVSLENPLVEGDRVEIYRPTTWVPDDDDDDDDD